jgi:hypothetical protein
MRIAAAGAVGTRGLNALGGELVDLLDDTEPRVRDAGHQALVKLNKGSDLGPSANASDADRAAAVKKWRDWWAKQGKR